jgi:hypothetical protein
VKASESVRVLDQRVTVLLEEAADEPLGEIVE